MVKPPILLKDVLRTTSKSIGKGLFGRVYQSTSEKGQAIAVKVLHKIRKIKFCISHSLGVINAGKFV